jgi:IS1 family transposase
VLGGRDTATFRQLYKKVKYLKNCTFTPMLGMLSRKPCRRAACGWQNPHIDIEHDNSNTRHHLSRFTRRTKAVSRTERMVDLALRIWHSVTTTNMFYNLQDIALYV